MGRDLSNVILFGAGIFEKLRALEVSDIAKGFREFNEGLL
jgi:hypothetical protein